MITLPRFWPYASISIIALLAVTHHCHGQSESHKSPSILFDGKTLDGWKGDRDYWSVQNGAIVGSIQKSKPLNHNTWLVWKGKPIGDFDLRMKVRLSGAAGANSGIQYRSQVKNIDHVSGYQADFDMGTTWLGRIYDEHGRAIVVERGTRVRIAPDGSRMSETFAPPKEFAILFRKNDWNEYRIVAVGDHVAIYINGTLFSELIDRETGQHETTGSLAFQLHSGGETRVEFKDIQLERLESDDRRIVPFDIKNTPKQEL